MITETINTLFHVVNFLKCVVTEVLFSIVAIRHDTHDTSCMSCRDVTWRDATSGILVTPDQIAWKWPPLSLQNFYSRFWSLRRWLGLTVTTGVYTQTDVAGFNPSPLHLWFLWVCTQIPSPSPLNAKFSTGERWKLYTLIMHNSSASGPQSLTGALPPDHTGRGASTPRAPGSAPLENFWIRPVIWPHPL